LINFFTKISLLEILTVHRKRFQPIISPFSFPCNAFADTGVKMAKVLVGTCGYGYNEWVGPVYPKGTKPETRLSLYSGLFPTLELDHTYYGMPKVANLDKMFVTGGPAPTFSIKVYRILAHEINPLFWEGEAKTYQEAIDPVLRAEWLETVSF
jgi:hypothetical protein